MELVGRLEAHDGSHERGCEGRNMSCTCGDDERGQALLTEAAACIREMVESLEDARTNVRAFAAPWAVTFARERGYPDGALHFAHYDILAKAGARMTDFTRHLPPAPGAEDE